MFLYTIVPLEDIFKGTENPSDYPSMVEVSVSGVKMQVIPTGLGQGKVSRLLSTDPMDFLREDLQPGSYVSWDMNQV